MYNTQVNKGKHSTQPEKSKSGFIFLLLKLSLASLGTVVVVLIAYKIAITLLKRSKKL